MFVYLLSLIFICAIIALIVLLVRVPIVIADMRGITGDHKTIITVLSWLGLLLGVTWVVALVFSLVWGGNNSVSDNNLERLEKLSKLYKDKVITKEEFERQKAKCLS